MIFYSIFIIYYLIILMAAIMLIQGTSRVSQTHQCSTCWHFHEFFNSYSATTIEWFCSWLSWPLVSFFNSSKSLQLDGPLWSAQSSWHVSALTSSSAFTRSTIKYAAKQAEPTLNPLSVEPQIFVWNWQIKLNDSLYGFDFTEEKHLSSFDRLTRRW